MPIIRTGVAVLALAMAAGSLPGQAPDVPRRSWMLGAEAASFLTWRGSGGGVTIGRMRDHTHWQLRLSAGGIDDDAPRHWVFAMDLGWGRRARHGAVETRWHAGPSLVTYHRHSLTNEGYGVAGTYAVEMVSTWGYNAGVFIAGNANTARSWVMAGVTAGVRIGK